MATPEHHDINYFKQRIKSRHRDNFEDMKRCINELQQIVNGLEKGLKVLKNHNKYPDQKVLDNKASYSELLEEFNNHIKNHEFK